jgi:hypothetical protein
MAYRDVVFMTQARRVRAFTQFVAKTPHMICRAHPKKTSSDGKIVIVGAITIAGRSRDFAVVRYNPNGTLDRTFGASGKITTDFSISMMCPWR